MDRRCKYFILEYFIWRLVLKLRIVKKAFSSVLSRNALLYVVSLLFYKYNYVLIFYKIIFSIKSGINYSCPYGHQMILK